MSNSDAPRTAFRPAGLEVVETRDGSATLYDPNRDAHYSSLHGARTESRHIFLEGSGLVERSGDWHVLELGFGAGINLRQLLRVRRGNREDLVYHGIDYAPVPPEDVPFSGDLGASVVRDLLADISTDSDTAVRQTGTWGRATLHPIRWCELELAGFAADAVFFDPFGPKVEPDSWSPECFEVARRHMADDGVLATYSAASDVKRAMFRADFAVASAPGPGPKREITYASPDPTVLESLDDTERLRRRRYLDE